MHLTFTEPGCSAKPQGFWQKHPTIKFLMRVGLSYIFLVSISIQLLLASHGNSQSLDSIKVTIELRNENLKTLFQKIEAQTGLLFGYPPREGDNLKVTLPRETRSVKETLDMAFAGTALLYRQVNNNVIVYNEKNDNEATAQANLTITVTGKVTGSDGVGIAGVNVIVKGTITGATTDADGNYSIEAIENDILVFSFIGYKSYEVPVNNQTVINLTMDEDVKTLGEVTVVSTGYQSVPKERATGSFVQIDNNELNQQVGTNVLKRLDGITSGLLFDIGKNGSGSGPAPKTNIRIRGLSTINGPTDPLIVLDGFIYEGDFNNINPNDVESISVLKDAAAASIWGARAGNGVIVIETKKGKFNQKLKISANANVIIGEKPDLSYLPQMKTSDYIFVEQFLFNKGFFNRTINRGFLALTPAVQVFLNRRSGLISAADSAAQIQALQKIDSRNEYNKHVYVTPVTQQYALNLSAGNDINAFSAGVAYDKNIGDLRNELDKINIRLENIVKPVKNLQLNLSGYFTNSQSTNGMPAYNTIRPASRAANYYRLAEEDGTPSSVQTLYRDSYTETAGGGNLLDWKYYPLEDYKHNKRKVELNELFANVGLTYRPTKFLAIDFKYQNQRQQSKNENVADIESFYTRDLINLFSQVDLSTGIVNYVVPLGGIKNTAINTTQSQTIRNQFNIDHSWNDHSINAIIGGEIREVKTSSESYAIYGYNEDPLTFSSVDFANIYPTTIGGFRAIPGAPVFTELTTIRFMSLYSNATYSYKGRYALSVSLRRDGSNTFGANTNDKWKPLWSVGGSWSIAEEDFYKFDFINYLKLRVTYGVSGNVDPTKTAVPVAAAIGQDYLSNLPQYLILKVNNPDLRWEQSKQTNIGLDFASKNQVIQGSIEYYLKLGSDLYGETLYDYTVAGITNVITKNVANAKGQGVDVAIQSTNLNKRIKWTTNYLFNYNKSKITEYFGPQADDVEILLGGGSYIVPVVGKDSYGIVAYKWGGLDSLGNPQGYVNGELSTDYNAILLEATTKKLDGGNIKYIGSGSPAFFGSLINTFTWKGFSLGINVSYKFKYYFLKPSLSYGGLYGAGSGHKEFTKRWQTPGDELKTNVPSMIYPNSTERDQFYAYSEINVLKGDHIRLQYINLGYTIKSSFGNIHLYANAANLGILWRANKYDLDPDYPSNLRPSRTWAMGVRVTF